MNLITPKNWNQLTIEQLEWLQSIYAKKMEEKAVFLSVIFLGLMKIIVENTDYSDELGVYLCHIEGNKKDKFLLRSHELHFFSQKLDWLLKDCTLNKSPYPILKLGKQTFTGPSNKLSNFSWKQYKTASDMYTLYIDSVNKNKPNDVLLYKFIATLFTPKRKLFNQETQDMEDVFVYSLSQISLWGVFKKRLKPEQVQVILMFWTGCCQYLSHSYRHLFKPAGKSKSKSKNDAEDLLKMNACTMAMVMDRIGLSEGDVNNSSAFTILQILDTIQMEADKQKEWMNKNGR